MNVLRLPRPHTSVRRPATRRGALLQEALLAIALTGVLLAGVSKLIGLALQQRHSAYQRFIARHEVVNLMEEACSRPWADLTTESLSGIAPNPAAVEQLPESKVLLRVISENERTRRIHLEISWLSRLSTNRQHFSLVAWRFQAPESKP